MLLRRVSLIALLFSLAAPSSFAQGVDDLLVPLSPSENTGKTKKKGAKAAKKPTAKAPKKGKKPGKGAKSEPDVVADDGLLVPLVEQKKTELLVKLASPVRGARLFVDDKDMGVVSKTPVEVAPGEHQVAVRRPGYRDFSKRVVAKEGVATELSVALEAMAGFVSVKADVPGARVRIDGEDRGTVPLEGLVLSVGSHEISVEREGFRTETQRIAVRAGRDYTVDIGMVPERLASSDEPRAARLTPRVETPPTSPLTPQPTPEVRSAPLTSRWYFWAGVGVAVVAAAAVGTAVATQPLDPNVDVCGGTCDSVINTPGRGIFGR